MVVFSYIGTMGKLKFHLQNPLNLTSTKIKVKNMLKANDIWENQENLVKQV